MEPPPPTCAFATSDASSKNAVDASTMATLYITTPFCDPTARTLRLRHLRVKRWSYHLDPGKAQLVAGSPSAPAAAGVASTTMKTYLVLALTMAAGVALPSAQESVPREWIDPDTGHRVVRLSDKPGSQSLYFHQYAYTPDGTNLLITTPTGVSAIDLKTRAIAKVVDGRVSLLMAGRKTGSAYYVKDG